MIFKYILMMMMNVKLKVEITFLEFHVTLLFIIIT